MKIYLACDHRGYSLAQELLKWNDATIGFEYVGPSTLDLQDDYVDFARQAAEEVMKDEVSADEDSLGVVICGSGAGVDIVANKVKGIRCCLGLSEEQVKAARTDDGVNMLALAADFTTIDEAKRLIQAFVTTPFATEERFVRRMEKIGELESGK